MICWRQVESVSLFSFMIVDEISSQPLAQVYRLVIIFTISSFVHGLRKMELSWLVGIYDKGSLVALGIFLSRVRPIFVK